MSNALCRGLCLLRATMAIHSRIYTYYCNGCLVLEKLHRKHQKLSDMSTCSPLTDKRRNHTAASRPLQLCLTTSRIFRLVIVGEYSRIEFLLNHDGVHRAPVLVKRMEESQPLSRQGSSDFIPTCMEELPSAP